MKHDKYENAVVALRGQTNVPLNKVERRHVATLQERIKFLKKKISENSHRDLGYCHQEISALEWALSRITQPPDNNTGANPSTDRQRQP